MDTVRRIHGSLSGEDCERDCAHLDPGVSRQESGKAKKLDRDWHPYSPQVGDVQSQRDRLGIQSQEVGVWEIANSMCSWCQYKN